jgi:hypothetical protein
MHFLVSDAECEQFLIDELRRSFAQDRHEVRAPGLVATSIDLQPEAPPTLVFARQFLPDAQEHEASSIAAWSQHLLAAAMERLPVEGPWRLHVVAHYGSGSAGQHRCRLIHQSTRELLRKKRRHLLRAL